MNTITQIAEQFEAARRQVNETQEAVRASTNNPDYFDTEAHLEIHSEVRRQAKAPIVGRKTERKLVEITDQVYQVARGIAG